MSNSLYAPKSKRSGYERDPYDWYVEPAWTVEALAEREPFHGTILDPCAGQGTIPAVFAARGHRALAGDIVDRGYPDTIDADWFDLSGFWRERVFDNIVSNPPYGRATEFIELALARARRKVAVLVRTDFLASQIRYPLFTRGPTARVYIFSRRPNIPPGGREVVPHGGQHDFCWIVWEHDHFGPPTIHWLLPERTP